MAKPIQLVHHCLPFCRVQTLVKDVEDNKLRREEVEMPFPLLQSSDDTRHLLSDLSQVLNLLQEGDWRTAIYQSLTSSKEDNGWTHLGAYLAQSIQGR